MSQISWTVWTDDGSLAWADPGTDHPGLREAVSDCASTLSPRGSTPALSTYWIDRMLELIDHSDEATVGHGDLWVLTRVGDTIELRMDVDPPESEPFESVAVTDLVHGLHLLRSEVVDQLAASHELDDRYWSQKNPYR